MKTTHLLYLAFLLALSFSCQSDEECEEPEKREEEHECIEYMPDEFQDGLSNSWDIPNEIDFFSAKLETPEDEYGGGYFTVSLSTEAPAIPAVKITSALDNSGVILGGSSVQTANEQTWNGSFLAYPGIDYSLEVTPFFEGNTEDYPWDYAISWTFHGRMDCYEPNNVLPDAKAIPKNEPIEAYAIAGHTKNFVAAGAEQTFDWYKFILDSASVVKVEILQSPSNITMGLRLFKSQDNIVGFNTVATQGELTDAGALFYIETMNALDPATYYLEVHYDKGLGQVNQDEPIPDHWDNTYKLKVTSIPQ